MKARSNMKTALLLLLPLSLSACIVVPIPISTAPVAIGRTSADTLPDYDYIDANGCRVVRNRDTGVEYRTCQ